MLTAATDRGSRPPSAAAEIFISYRRQEANYLAGWLHDRLADHFGNSRVFLDVDWIKPGARFMEAITEAIAHASAVIVIIGPRWLDADREGRKRLETPGDPVRVEIETAFRHGVAVVPLLLDGATMPSPDDLPPELRRLTQINAVRVNYDSFRVDVDQLVRSLEALGATPSPAVVEPGPAPSPSPPSTTGGTATSAGSGEQQRARLLRRLEKTYAEYLDQAVGHDRVLRLDLELEQCPGRTFRPQERILGIPDKKATRKPAGTSLLQAFDNTGGLDGDGLLVLGGPGAGKTTLLFGLAQQLVDRARVDPHHPIPIYLPLSTWTARRQRLGEWLVDQLGELYQIPRPLADAWTTDSQLLFVLDGLDEIADRRDRAAGVLAINQFNRFGRTSPLPVLVASRPAEYDALPAQLQLDTAIEIRSLDADRVLDRLEHDTRMRSAVVAVRRDPDLLDLLRSPLLVSMLTLA